MYGAQLAAVPSYRLDLGEPWDIPKIYWVAMSEGRMRESLRQVRASGDTTTFEGMDPDGDLGPFTTPDDQLSAVVDGTDWMERKVAAMKAHRSQIAPDGPFFALGDSVGTSFWSQEYYRIVKGSPGPTGPDGLETDLFAGL
jgi:N-acetyl-1-D-myo-inositol-2-amino-2-deoxy-alpha-D-glucopyranoside deacetylase